MSPDDASPEPETTAPEREAPDDTGKRVVRRAFVERLAEAGVQPAKGQNRAQHDATMERLVEALAYMTRANLAVLAEQVIANCAATGRPNCLPEVTIRHFAEVLQKSKPINWPVVTSWLSSIEGPRARAEGYLTELYQYLMALPTQRPPFEHDMRVIREQAKANEARIARVRERAARGIAERDELEWFDAWQAAAARAEALVAAGEARRGEKAAE